MDWKEFIVTNGEESNTFRSLVEAVFFAYARRATQPPFWVEQKSGTEIIPAPTLHTPYYLVEYGTYGMEGQVNTSRIAIIPAPNRTQAQRIGRQLAAEHIVASIRLANELFKQDVQIAIPPLSESIPGLDPHLYCRVELYYPQQHTKLLSLYDYEFTSL